MLIVGGLYLDVKLQVSAYPPEDGCSTCHTVTKERGGNSGNTAAVLASLLAPHRESVWWVGTVPPEASDADSAFVLAALLRSGVVTDLREEVGGAGLPTAYITISREAAAVDEARPSRHDHSGISAVSRTYRRV